MGRFTASAGTSKRLETSLVLFVHVNVLRILVLPVPLLPLDVALRVLEESFSVFSILVKRALVLATISIVVDSCTRHLIILPVAYVDSTFIGPEHQSKTISFTVAPIAWVKVSSFVHINAETMAMILPVVTKISLANLVDIPTKTMFLFISIEPSFELSSIILLLSSNCTLMALALFGVLNVSIFITCIVVKMMLAVEQSSWHLHCSLRGILHEKVVVHIHSREVAMLQHHERHHVGVQDFRHELELHQVFVPYETWYNLHAVLRLSELLRSLA